MAVDVGLEAIRDRLAAYEPARYRGPPPSRKAAVAAVLRPAAADTEVLLIRRAERVGDPWSGHMALPGGHEEPADDDLLATAVRETREELGVDLAQHELLGRLDEHAATARGRFTGIVIAPFVFALQGEAVLDPNGEVAEYVWAPLGPMVRGELDAVKELERDGERLRLPGYGVRGHIVWGLTHRMLTDLFATLEL